MNCPLLAGTLGHCAIHDLGAPAKDVVEAVQRVRQARTISVAEAMRLTACDRGGPLC